MLYHSLFKSHLTYGLTVWGGVAKSKLDPLFKLQKHVLRLLFGDLIAYNDKFKTCARTRSFGNQRLGPSFYCREHTKPLFKYHMLLALPNLYTYHCCYEILKILKFRIPMPLYSSFELSQRNNGMSLISSLYPSNQFNCKVRPLWNTALKLIAGDDDNDFSMKTGSFKNHLKTYLLNIQSQYDYIDPIEWYPGNFEFKRINLQ